MECLWDHVAEDLKNRLNREYDLHELASRIGDHKLGKKTGEGFYTYKKGKCIRSKKKYKNGFAVAGQFATLINAMTDEAQKVIDERVCTDKDMVDFAMIMGTGWAPFKGGPVQYAESNKEINVL